MFGVGPQEMMMIALFALIIFGPGKLPEVMREAGKHYRKFRSYADEMTGELNKVTAEARKELDGAFGDLGPMGKDLEKSLGVGSKSRTTTTGSKSTTSSTAKKSTTSTSSKRTATGSRTTAAGSKTSAAKGGSDSAKTTSATKTSTKPLVASKEDPLADFALFEGEKKERRQRSRSATPSSITDITPRDIFVESETEVVEAAPVDLVSLDDPIARARARRRTAGYARA